MKNFRSILVVVTLFSGIFLCAGQASDLRNWLSDHPAIENAIVWVQGDGNFLLYPHWTWEMKKTLQNYFTKMRQPSSDLNLQANSQFSPTTYRVYYPEAQAFELFAANVAHVLDIEINKRVPWSITSLPPVQLKLLLSSDSYFARIAPSKTNTYPTGIQADRDFADVPENDNQGEANSDPRIGFDFVSGKTSGSHRSLIGNSPIETLALLTVFMRDNYGHGDPHNGRKSYEAHRWLTQRLSADPILPYGVMNYGCHSAGKLMVDLARSVNIPLLAVRNQNDGSMNDGHFFNRTHAGLVFGYGTSDWRMLWHTDEIYCMPGEPCIPFDENTGTLYDGILAAKIYFDHRWLKPQTLTKAGFVICMKRVIPEKGFGQTSRQEYEDRYDFGILGGYWKNNANSDLSSLLRLVQNYDVLGSDWFELHQKNLLLPRLKRFIRIWSKGFSTNDLLEIHSPEDYDKRVSACLKAVGGQAGIDKLIEVWKNNRSKDLTPRNNLQTQNY
ncbi:MAG: hypothetical protein HQM08_24635 [Candidatus Riflebacteria bacterium]|nr:hypothetical protein [Candidatus Riflebacteria bacterium]